MTTAHVYFADVPLSPVAAKEGHRSTFDSDYDATLQQRQSRDCSISPVPPGNNSPVPSTPRYERNMGFFRQLSRRFGLRSNDDLVYSGSNEDDNQSSSTDSCSSHAGVVAMAAKEICKDGGQKQFTAMTELISCNSSETSSTVDIEEQHLHQQQREQQQQRQQTASEVDSSNTETPKVDKQPAGHKDRKSFARSSFSRLQRRSTTSIRRAFEAFSLSSRSLSCSGATPPPPPLLSSQSHTSSASSSTNNGTPIKSTLKSSSNLELNKKSGTSASTATCSSFNTTSSSASVAAASATSSSSSWSSSSSSSATKSSSKTKTKPPPQRILRQPVSYTYLKGISGLPTQRVPRSSVCCQYARR